MSSFRDGMCLLPPAVRLVVRARLVEWATRSDIGRVVVTNLDPLERFLPPESMARLLGAIARGASGDLGKVATAYEKACLKQVKRGGPVRLPKLPPVIGRAVERDRFVQHLLRHSDHFGGREKEVQSFVEQIILGIPLEGSQSAVLMSAYASWASWDRDFPAAPFAFAGDSAEKVRASMGLDPDARCDDGLLLLIYDRPDKTSLLRPTVADAGLFLFFEPPPVRFNNHGLTKPWLPGLCGVDGYSPQPRPEAIHEPVEARHLHLPVRVAF
jgi:hypothetical protein